MTTRTLALWAMLAMASLSTAARAQSPAPQPDVHDRPHMLDQSVYFHGIFNQLEGRFGQTSSFRWSGESWVGTDENKIWLRTEGRVEGGQVDDGIQELFYAKSISTYFNALVGARYDLDSQPGRGWGAIGIEGLAPQFFRVGVTGYISGDGHLGAKLEGSYDILFTQRLILQPQFEMNFYTKDDPTRGIGAGLSELDVGLRLRYEITRQIAPYIGVTYLGKFGNTANYVLQSGGNPNEVRFVTGVRAWF